MPHLPDAQRRGTAESSTTYRANFAGRLFLTPSHIPFRKQATTQPPHCMIFSYLIVFRRLRPQRFLTPNSRAQITKRCTPMVSKTNRDRPNHQQIHHKGQILSQHSQAVTSIGSAVDQKSPNSASNERIRESFGMRIVGLLSGCLVKRKASQVFRDQNRAL